MQRIAIRIRILTLLLAQSHPESSSAERVGIVPLGRFFRLVRPCRFYPSGKTPNYTFSLQVFLFARHFLTAETASENLATALGRSSKSHVGDNDNVIVIRNRMRLLLRVFGVTDHLVGFSLDATVFKLLLLLLL